MQGRRHSIRGVKETKSGGLKRQDHRSCRDRIIEVVETGSEGL